jgi:hypothetical protein
MFPEIRPLGLTSRFEAEKLKIILAEDRQMIARAESVVSALGELKAQTRVLIGHFVEFTENIDNRMIECGLYLGH